MVRVLFNIKVILVHVFYVLYSSILWWKLIEVGNESGDHNELYMKIALAGWFTVFLTLQAVMIYYAFNSQSSSFHEIVWCNVPMLIFVVFNLPPYGFTLNHLYSVKEVKQGNNDTTCSTSSDAVPMVDFITLQMVMPILLLTFILYPLPKRKYALSEYLAIAVEFMNAFDIMDMVADIYFVRNYGLFWVLLFYISMAISSVLISITIKIEKEDLTWPQNVVISSNMHLGSSMTSILDAPVFIETDSSGQRTRQIKFGSEIVVEENFIKSTNQTQRKVSMVSEKTDEVDTHPNAVEKVKTKDTCILWRKLLKVALTMIFTDLSFAALRFKIMLEETSADYGFNMFVKNVILAGLHASYLAQHAKSLIAARLS